MPRALTVPSGHVDKGETPQGAAVRELAEETGLSYDKLTEIADEKIVGDSCSAGADCHRWHAFIAIADRPNVVISDEGEASIWLTLDEVLQKDLVTPVRWVIEWHKTTLETA